MLLLRTFTILAGTLLILLPGKAGMGAANAQLECRSVDSKTGTLTLKGSIPGDFAEFRLELENKQGKVVMSDAQDNIHVIEDFKRQVFTMTVARVDGPDLQLYAIPNTIKVRRGANRLVDASFDAILLEAPKPEYDGPVDSESVLRGIKMRCTYKYSI